MLWVKSLNESLKGLITSYPQQVFFKTHCFSSSKSLATKKSTFDLIAQHLSTSVIPFSGKPGGSVLHCFFPSLFSFNLLCQACTAEMRSSRSRSSMLQGGVIPHFSGKPGGFVLNCFFPSFFSFNLFCQAFTTEMRSSGSQSSMLQGGEGYNRGMSSCAFWQSSNS